MADTDYRPIISAPLVVITVNFRAYCYAELTVSSLAMAVIIASTHFAYPRRDGQAELAWVAGYIQRWSTRFEDGHPSKY